MLPTKQDINKINLLFYLNKYNILFYLLSVPYLGAILNSLPKNSISKWNQVYLYACQ